MLRVRKLVLTATTTTTTTTTTAAAAAAAATSIAHHRHAAARPDQLLLDNAECGGERLGEGCVLSGDAVRHEVQVGHGQGQTLLLRVGLRARVRDVRLGLRLRG